MKIDYQILYDEAVRVLMDRGIRESHAVDVAEVLLYADLAGRKTHGLARFGYYLKRIDDELIDITSYPDIMKFGDNNVAIDGKNGLGQTLGILAMDYATERAAKNNVGIVCVKNSSHFGTAGYYSLMAVKKGLVGITFTNARPAVAARGGIIPTLGTNPYSIGFPSDTEYPFLIDCATSEIQRGDVEQRGNGLINKNYYTADKTYVASNLLEKLKKGQAALNPIGRHKGFGLSLAIDLSCSAFVSGSFLDD